MSPRLKYLLILFALFPSGFIAISISVINVSAWFGIAILVWAIFIEVASSKIRCDDCGRPVGWHRYKLFHLSFNWWNPLPGKQCENCGGNLMRRPKTKNKATDSRPARQSSRS